MGHCLAAFVLASFALAACTTVQPDAGIIGPPNNWQLQAQAAAAHADCVAALDVIERAESSYSVLSFGVRAEFLETGTCLPQDTQKAANQYRKLAETNLDARAAARLGAMYLEGMACRGMRSRPKGCSGKPQLFWRSFRRKFVGRLLLFTWGSGAFPPP